MESQHLANLQILRNEKLRFPRFYLPYKASGHVTFQRTYQ